MSTTMPVVPPEANRAKIGPIYFDFSSNFKIVVTSELRYEGNVTCHVLLIYRSGSYVFFLKDESRNILLDMEKYLGNRIRALTSNTALTLKMGLYIKRLFLLPSALRRQLTRDGECCS